MDSILVNNIGKYAKLFFEKKYIESGYIAVRESDGIVITREKTDLNNIGADSVVFVNDKNIESFDGNFRAAAVILFCVIRQDKTAEAAAIVDSDSILQFSNKRKPLQPVLDSVARYLGITVKCSAKNVAAEIVASLSGYRNACFLPDAGAVVRARSLGELSKAVAALDNACTAELLAENKGGTQHLNPVNAFTEQVVYRMKTAKAVEAENVENTKKSEQNAEIDVANTENNPTEADVSENADNNSAAAGEGATVNADDSDNAKANNQNGNKQPSEQTECENISKVVTLENGKVTALACSCHIGAVAAIGKPMAVTDGFKEEFGEEIECLPSKMIASDKAFKKMAETLDSEKVYIMAQHGAVLFADDKDKLSEKADKLEEACKAYFKA